MLRERTHTGAPSWAWMRRLAGLAAWGVLVGAIAVGAAAEQASPRQAHSDVELIQEIDLEDFGSSTGLRLGDLTGDGRLDFALAQHENQNVTCITAMDFMGEILWQEGTPDRSNISTHHDLPIQIYDLTGDGANEVIYITDGRIRVRAGATGALLKEGELPAANANDAITLADLAGNGRAEEILVKDRYNQIWALGRDFEVLWTFRSPGNIAHFPWPHDITGDGHDEVLIGPFALDRDGVELWFAEDFPEDRHSDGTAVGDVTGDGQVEIAIASCNPEVVLVDREGALLWKNDVRHAQHAIIGDFRPDLPGLEVAVLDRDTDRSAQGEDAIIIYGADGETLWHEERTDEGSGRWLSVITQVPPDWDGEAGDLILGYRRGGALPPTLYDGHGRVVAEFPFPNPGPSSLAQHGDILGDGRREIVVWDGRLLQIYTNAAKPAGERAETREPDKRLYNYTHYIGMP